MRILFPSNVPWSWSGYGGQTRKILTGLQKLGHEVACLGFYGLSQGKIDWNGVPVYPRYFHPFGEDILPAHAAHFAADVVMTLVDAWVYDPAAWGTSVKWCPLIPVDTEPMSPLLVARARQSFFPMTISRSGWQAAAEAGVATAYAPLMTETEVFKPSDRGAARRATSIPADRFVVGMVGVNKDFPCRKALPQGLMAFAEFHRRHPESLLYLHSAFGPEGGERGVDLVRLAQVLEIADAVHFTDPSLIEYAFDDQFMARLYASFDVLLMPSLGEGFGLPILEAQACGIPVIVGDWTAMPELLFGGWKIPKSEAARFWTGGHAWHFVPRVGAIVDVLEEAWRHAGEDSLKAAARAGAMAYDAGRVMAEHWVPALAALEGRLLEAASAAPEGGSS